jgi:hypothetical protein
MSEIPKDHQRLPAQPEGKQAKRKRALTFRLFLGTNPKTGRQKKAHARAMALVTNSKCADELEAAPLSKRQKKRARFKKAREALEAKGLAKKCEKTN